MHRLTLIRKALIIALLTLGLVACGGGNVEIPTLMPTLPAAQTTAARPAVTPAAPTQATPVKPAASQPAPAQRSTPTPVTAAQDASTITATLVADGNHGTGGNDGAEIDQALGQFQQDLASQSLTDGASDGTDAAIQSLNQLGQSLDNSDTLSDVVKSAP